MHILQMRVSNIWYSRKWYTFPIRQRLEPIYKKAELEAIYQVCKERGLYLFMDGARLGYGLMCKENDLTLSDITANTDVFYIGGTKVGALFWRGVVSAMRN